MEQEILVNRSWLERLTALAQAAQEYAEAESTLAPATCYSLLIGFASSAKHLIQNSRELNVQCLHDACTNKPRGDSVYCIYHHAEWVAARDNKN